MYKKGYTVYRNHELPDWPQVSLEKLLEAAVQDEDGYDLMIMIVPKSPDGVADLEWEVSQHAGMYVMADKYDIGGLKSYSLDQMCKCVAFQSKESIWLIVDLVVSTVLDTTALNDRLGLCFANNINYYKEDSRFKAMLKQHSDIAFAVINELANKP